MASTTCAKNPLVLREMSGQQLHHHLIYFLKRPEKNLFTLEGLTSSELKFLLLHEACGHMTLLRLSPAVLQRQPPESPMKHLENVWHPERRLRYQAPGWRGRSRPGLQGGAGGPGGRPGSAQQGWEVFRSKVNQILVSS